MLPCTQIYTSLTEEPNTRDSFFEQEQIDVSQAGRGGGGGGGGVGGGGLALPSNKQSSLIRPLPSNTHQSLEGLSNISNMLNTNNQNVQHFWGREGGLL